MVEEEGFDLTAIKFGEQAEMFILPPAACVTVGLFGDQTENADRLQIQGQWCRSTAAEMMQILCHDVTSCFIDSVF